MGEKRAESGLPAAHEWREIEFRAGGVALHARLKGAGAPVLLVHGYPLSGLLWDETVAALGDGFEVIVPDLRGFGASEASDEASMGRYADDLAALLAALGESRPVVVVGHSMGGYVAFEFFRRHPEQVRAVALVDTRAKPDAPEAAGHRLDVAALALREGAGAATGPLADRLFSDAARPDLRARWRERMARPSGRAIAAAQRAMAARPDSSATLREMNVPVLVVVGADDAISPPSEAREMAREAPEARLDVIADAGHMTPVERPAALAAALGGFFRDLPPPPDWQAS